VGLFLGLMLAALLEYRDTSLRSEGDILAFTKLPTLAVISHLEGLPQPVRAGKQRKFPLRMNKSTECANG